MNAVAILVQDVKRSNGNPLSCSYSVMAAQMPLVAVKREQQDGTIVPFCKAFGVEQAGGAARNALAPAATQTAAVAGCGNASGPSAVTRAMSSGTASAEPSAATPVKSEADTPIKRNARWQYKKKFMPAHARAEWDNIEAMPNRGSCKNTRKKSFIAAAVDAIGQTFDSPFFNKFRTVEEVTESGSEWAWISWKKLTDEEGDDVAMEMINNGTVESRMHKNLKQDSKLKWPQTHQFRRVADVGSNKTRKTDTTALQDEAKTEVTDSVLETFNETWDKSAPAPPSKKVARKPEQQQKTVTQKATEEIAKTHRLWDEFERTTTALLSKAESNEYVAPKLKEDIKSALKNGKDLDDKLCAEEAAIKNGRVVNDADYDVLNNMCAEMKDVVEKTKKLNAKVGNSLKDTA